MIRDLIFMCPLRALASAWFSSGLPTFLYVFDFSYGLAKLIGLGDFHGSELPFVFRNWLEFIKPIDPFQSPRRMSDIINHFIAMRYGFKDLVERCWELCDAKLRKLLKLCAVHRCAPDLNAAARLLRQGVLTSGNL
eukprot:s3152_g4.t1